MKFETDLDKIKLLGTKKKDENFSFRAYLKLLDIEFEVLDKLVYSLNEEVTKQIDCTKCANCCKSIKPELNKTEIEKFAKGLNISKSYLTKTYCVLSEDEKNKFNFNELPCPFLEDNKCSNYEFRPNDCESYPHLDKGDFVLKLLGVISNYSICPIVFNVFEKLKVELWNKNWKHSIKRY
ncbi:MAG: YkgJ family cysteine cluster protein [Melioribacteraceae bacterium]|nr:YkgJ family cysteine cluster protein [Melioribacteraceae bacterium]